MNFTGRLSLANDNNSEETNGWNSTGTTARSPTPWWLIDIEWPAYVHVVVLWIIFVVGSLGNIMVLVVLIWRRSGSQVGTQLFVGSLAVADIGQMLSSVWIMAYGTLRISWEFGVAFCKVHFMGDWLTFNCSIWTLAVLSIDRFLGMKKLGGNVFKANIAAIIVACIWIWNLAFSSLVLMWATVRIGEVGEPDCYPATPPAYSLAARIINFYVPLVITWTSYIGIIYKLKRSMNKAILYNFETRCRSGQTH